MKRCEDEATVNMDNTKNGRFDLEIEGVLRRFRAWYESGKEAITG